MDKFLSRIEVERLCFELMFPKGVRTGAICRVPAGEPPQQVRFEHRCRDMPGTLGQPLFGILKRLFQTVQSLICESQPKTDIRPARERVRMQSKSKLKERDRLLGLPKINHQAIGLRDECLRLLGVQFQGPVKAFHLFIVIAHLVVRTGQVFPDARLAFIEFGCSLIVLDGGCVVAQRSKNIGEIVEDLPGMDRFRREQSLEDSSRFENGGTVIIPDSLLRKNARPDGAIFGLVLSLESAVDLSKCFFIAVQFVICPCQKLCGVGAFRVSLQYPLELENRRIRLIPLDQPINFPELQVPRFGQKNSCRR